MLTVSNVSYALCAVVEIRFLASCEYHRRDTSRYRGHKIKTKGECLDAPLGDCFVLWHAGDIAKFVDRFRGFGVLTALISYYPWE